MSESYIKDLLLEENKFKFADDKKSVVFDNYHHLNARILASKDNYYFLRLNIESELDNDFYFGLFNMKSDGYLYEVEPQGNNREKLNDITILLNEEMFDVELLLNEKILILAIKFLIYSDWDVLVYELDEFKKTDVINNLRDFLY